MSTQPIDTDGTVVRVQAEHTPGPWSVSELDASGQVSEYYIFIEPGVAVIERKSPGHDEHDMPDAHLLASAKVLLAALKSAEYAVNVTRATLLDSVETHGTHGGWLHTEALRLDSELDLIRAAIAKATGSAT